MLEMITTLAVSTEGWAVAGFSGLLIGMAKAGVAGTGILFVPLMAHAFGGMASTGIVLPMLIVADIYAVKHYHRHAERRYLVAIMPWALVGILIGVAVGKSVSPEGFRIILAMTVLVCIVTMIWRDLKRDKTIPQTRWFAVLTGLAGGFATMIGNTAGPILAVYLLAMRIPKNRFIGTAAWFFLLVNLFKVPLHIFVWRTITLQTLMIDLLLVPVILLGVYLGIRLVRLIPETPYRILVIVSSAVSALALLR
jgi:uncharacterized protein